MWQFAGIELGDDPVPDKTLALNFRCFPEKRQLTEHLFVEVTVTSPTDHAVLGHAGRCDGLGSC